MDPCEVANHLDEFRNRIYSIAVAYLLDALPLWFFLFVNRSRSVLTLYICTLVAGISGINRQAYFHQKIP